MVAELTGRRHRCPVCPAAFRHSGHLTYHIRTHSGERPFQCELCLQRFTRNTLRRQHILLKHGVEA